MRFKNSTISNTHHKLIVMDVDAVIDSYINTDKLPSERANLTLANYVEEAKNIVPSLKESVVNYCLNNEDKMENLIVIDEYDEEADSFPNSYLSPGPLYYVDDDMREMLNLLCE